MRLHGLIILIPTLFSFGISSNAQPKKATADKIVAVIGDQIVLQSDIADAAKDAIRQGNPDTKSSECSIIEQALMWKFLIAQAEKDSIRISDEDIDAEYNSRIQQWRDQVSPEETAAFEARIKTAIKEMRIVDAVKQNIVGNVTITPTEVKSFFEKIPPNELPFIDPTVEVGQIVVYPKASHEAEQNTIDELNNYKRQVQTKVAGFEQLVDRFSQDIANKNHGEYRFNRNDNGIDPAFSSVAFRLKENEISAPVKSKFGYHIIQMIRRDGDDVTIRHILRIPQITAKEIDAAKAKLDTVRAQLVTGTIGFNAAASLYNEELIAKHNGPFLLDRDGETRVTIDQLDRNLGATIIKMKIGEYSIPEAFRDETERKAVRIVYLKSRFDGHRMNLRDDYVKISRLALESKKDQMLQTWIMSKLGTSFINIDPEVLNKCPQLNKYQNGN